MPKIVSIKANRRGASPHEQVMMFPFHKLNSMIRETGCCSQVGFLVGIGVGLLFPILGTLLQAVLENQSLIAVQRSTPLLWILDSAPLVLGFAGHMLGRRQTIIQNLNLALEEKVRERTLELEAVNRNLDREVKERRKVEAEVREACRIQMHAPLPVENEEPDSREDPDPIPERRKVSQGARVLLVDDNPVNQKVAALMLRKLGCSVFVADNGLEAVQLTECDAFDLVLMDCHMPVMDGFEATRRIRDQETGESRTPILALTASTLKSDQRLCFDAGMDDHISKPIKSDVLAERLDHWLKENATLKA